MAGTRESEKTDHALPRDDTAFPSGKWRYGLLISSLGWRTMQKITQEQRGGNVAPLSLLLLSGRRRYPSETVARRARITPYYVYDQFVILVVRYFER